LIEKGTKIIFVIVSTYLLDTMYRIAVPWNLVFWFPDQIRGPNLLYLVRERKSKSKSKDQNIGDQMWHKFSGLKIRGSGCKTDLGGMVLVLGH
jgi:hypothetical protein